MTAESEVDTKVLVLSHSTNGVAYERDRLSEPGNEYMFRERAEGKNAVAEIFANVHKHYKNLSQEQLSDVSFAKTNLPFAGDLYMGHLRYSTTGKSGLSYVHPFLRRNNWKAKNLCMCGNFNMTNIEDVFEILTEQGQCPRIYSDTNILLELMGHRLDREVERNFVDAQKLGLEKRAITHYIEENVQMSNVLKTTMQHFDGGYVICGLTGSGEMFSIRDPWSIRPAFYYKNDEIVVLASERPVLQTTFDLECDDIQELKPGQALIVNKRGECSLQQILEPKQNAACSFERIYFSRGSDRDIYKERETLGRQLTEPVLKAVDYDTEHTVLSYIPNTAEVAFYGLVHGFKEQIDKKKVEQIAALGSNASSEEVYRIIHQDVRSEKVAWKDIKLRTFITEGNSRNDLASHVYDVTYECIKPYEDNLVIKPKGETISNAVRAVYKPFTVDEINKKIVEMLRPEGMTTPVELVFQSVEGLHNAIPNHPGDWYFTGNYPTPGGMRLVNEAFVSYYEREHLNTVKA